MPKKTKKGKDRLDKYYELAKEQGFRSRASFKLVQLNRVYGFLQKSQTIVDLCAAPGSWMQVAAKYMPVTAFCVGIDLDPIKKIRGCASIVGDITTQKTLQEIRASLRGRTADLVLHDGAPNVGGTWDRDAYNQNLLVLASARICTELLCHGGTFVTKVFRSVDYPRLLWVLEQLFERVDATKPLASRQASAEIFVVCRGYRKPKELDERLLDPKHVFQELDPMEGSADAKSPFGGRRAQGYTSTAAAIYSPIPAVSFIGAADPAAALVNANAITFEDETSQRVLGHTLTTDEIKYLCSDVRMLSKHDTRVLLKWREKIANVLSAEKRAAVSAASAGDKIRVIGGEDDERAGRVGMDVDDEDDEAAIDEALQRELKTLRSERERATKKASKKRVAKRLRMAMRGSFLPHDDPRVGGEGDDSGFAAEGFDAARATQPRIQSASSSDGSDSDSDASGSDSGSDDSEYDGGKEHEARLARRAAAADADMDALDDIAAAENAAPYFKQQAHDIEMKRAAMGLGKGKALLGVGRMFADDDEGAVGTRGQVGPTKRARPHGLYDEDADDGVISDNDEDEDDDVPAGGVVPEDAAVEVSFLDRIRRAFGGVAAGADDAEADVPAPRAAPAAPLGRSKATEKAAAATVAAVAARRGAALAPSLLRLDQWDDDAAAPLSGLHPSLSTKTVVTDKALERRIRYEIKHATGEEEQLDDEDPFHVDPEVRRALRDDASSSDDEGNDDDADAKTAAVGHDVANKKRRLTTGFDEVPELLQDPNKRAIALALAKRMLDKKERRDILEAGVNRYCFNDDEAALPRWFVEDEKKHIYRELTITKAEVEAEKQRFRELCQRTPHRVAQAIARKRRKASNLLKKVVDKEKSDPKYKGKTAGLTVRKLMRSQKLKSKQMKKKEQVDGRRKKEKVRERRLFSNQKKSGGKSGLRRSMAKKIVARQTKKAPTRGPRGFKKEN